MRQLAAHCGLSLRRNSMPRSFMASWFRSKDRKHNHLMSIASTWPGDVVANMPAKAGVKSGREFLALQESDRPIQT